MPDTAKRIAFFGGSFNPPHFSHFLAATWALCTGEVDQIWMTPCAQHAFGKPLAPFHHRFEMCRLGAQLISTKIIISDIEQDRSGTSYTIDTIKLLKQQHPHKQFRLMIGSDILEQTDSWKDFDELTTLAPLLLVPRAGWHDPDDPTPQLPQISSTAIRKAILTQQDTSLLLPQPIRDYIETHKLYKKEMS